MAAKTGSGDEQSLSSYLEGLQDRQWTTFQKTLRDFPHTFQLEEQHLLTGQTFRKLLQTVQVNLEAGLSTPLEIARTHNFLGYLHFQLRKTRKSLEHMQQALEQEGESRNIVSVANTAVVLWHDGQRQKAREHVGKLESLKDGSDFHYLVVKAKAELAFSCTWSGAHFAPQAVKILTEVIAEGRAPEVWLWKFELALMERRAVHDYPSVLATDTENDRLVRALRTLLEVIEKCQNDNLKAKCYSEVAQLLHGVWRSQSRAVLQQVINITPVQACKRALALDPNDCGVLWKCGRVFRYAKLLDDSCQHLKKSVEARPTTTACHHLGLTYIALADKAKNPGRRGASQRGRDRYIRGDEADRERGRQRTRGGQSDGLETERCEFFSPEKGNGASEHGESRREWKGRGDSDTQLNRLNAGLSCLSLTVDGSPAGASCSPRDTQSDEQDHSTSPLVAFPRLKFDEKFDDSPTTTDEHTSKKIPMLHDINFLQRTLKPPSKKPVTFCRSDEFIPEAMNAFEKAVELGQGENYRAAYDLASMHRSLGEWDKALELLDSILQGKQFFMGPFERINAFELAGLILKDKSDVESNELQRKQLQEEGESKLNMALRLCSKLCNRLPGLQYFIQHVWLAFPTLIHAAEHSNNDNADKLQEKARLYRLIRDNQQSMALLQQIQSIDPEKSRNPDFLKMCIENYVDQERYDDALTFIEVLKNTAQRSTMDLFEDDRYVHKIYLQAGKAALLSVTAGETQSKAKSYFCEAFNDALSDIGSGTTSDSEDAESSDESGGNELWDILLLCDESAEDKAKVLAQVLKEACGLYVTCMAEDCLPGRPELTYLMMMMVRCKQVVVLAGASHISRKLQFLMDKAVKRRSTVALLVEGDHVPKVLKSTARRYMVCPQQLLSESGCGVGRGYTQMKVQAVYDVINFLTDVPRLTQ